ncbi:unnamed protein product [Alopecurus aequalis]
MHQPRARHGLQPSARTPVATAPSWLSANIVYTHRIGGHQESVNHSGNVGFIVTPSGRRDQNFTVVELLPVTAGESSTILCYDSESRIWVKKTLQSSMPRYPWSSANVFSHNNNLWWVDLRHGILSFDPLADDPQPQVLFVPFPNEAAATTTVELHAQKLKLRQRAGHATPTTTTPLMRGDVSKRRCVNLSAGNLRFVEMLGSARVPRVTVWTLVDPQACRWKLDYDVKLKEIWDDESYKGTGLPSKRPVLAGVHPADPAVVYFLNKGKLFGVNLGTKRVDECVPFQPALTDPTQLDIDEESSRFLLPWDLPPSLTSLSERRHGKELSAQTNGERSSRTSALHMISSFMNAYTSGMYNTDVELGQKRKRLSCFACDSEIRHPNNGFVAGHLHAS